MSTKKSHRSSDTTAVRITLKIPQIQYYTFSIQVFQKTLKLLGDVLELLCQNKLQNTSEFETLTNKVENNLPSCMT